MKITVNEKFVRIITFGFAKAITLWPFGIFLRYEYLKYSQTSNHERIHWQQQKELLGLFFYLQYFFEWIIRLIGYSIKSMAGYSFELSQAYKDISFEREAYGNDHNNFYLLERKMFSHLKYIFK